MKRSEELRALLRQRPFQPFRVHLRDGRSFEIRYPYMNLVGESFFVIGIPEANDVPNPMSEDWVLVDMSAVERVEPGIAASPTAE